MKKLNNKGFAISTMLYGLLIIILLVVAMILSTMAFSRKNSREFTEKIVDDLEKSKKYVYDNKNIVKAYTYDEKNEETKCITGNETTCKQISIINNTSVPAGTIIDYKVNDTETVRFHVMFDENNTLIMQSQKNTVDYAQWYEVYDKSKGPLTILQTLNNVASKWTNVNNQTYQMGVTVFKTNQYTGCSTTNICGGNVASYPNYTLPPRTEKARMITVQEAVVLGCKYSEYKSCPIWAYNYLQYSKSYSGGTVDYNPNSSKSNYGYWTMSVCESCTAYVTGIDYNGRIIDHDPTALDYGARAVVVINK